MQTIGLEQAQAGAILAQPVLDARGRILLQTGSVLTAPLLERLARWRIATVTIESPEVSGSRSPAAFTIPSWQELFAEHAECAELERIRSALHAWLQRQSVICE